MSDLSTRLSQRIKQLRHEHDYSLDDLAALSSVSRASLSRLEKGEVSPTAEVLGKLCAVYKLPMSRLMSMVEDQFAPLVQAQDQTIWRDEDTGFTRTNISAPALALKGEVIRCTLQAGREISYDQPSLAGLEHHLIVEAGELEVNLDNQTYALKTGDCLRYQLHSASRFKTPPTCSATYLLVLI